MGFGDCEIILLEPGGGEKTVCRLWVTVPGRYSDNEALAHEVCSFVANYLTITHDDARFLILHETERVEIDDSGESVSGPRVLGGSVPAFSSAIGRLDETTLTPEAIASFDGMGDPLSAYTDGLDAISELDKFRHFYRVIEWKFDPGKKTKNVSAKESLRKSQLPKLIEKLLEKHEQMQYNPQFFDAKSRRDHIDLIVDLRNQCSHLRKGNFGYSTQDLQELRDIRTWIPLIQRIAKAIVMGKTEQLNS
jgi:hypothetical protein